MLTSQAVCDSVREFQRQELAQNDDYSTLAQHKGHLEARLLRHQYLSKRLQLLYAQIDKTRNYQEFVDVLMNSRSLLREIFTMEAQGRRTNSAEPEVDWSKFGVDLQAYVGNDDQLLTLYNDGLL